jgi:hypothetical protein
MEKVLKRFKGGKQEKEPKESEQPQKEAKETRTTAAMRKDLDKGVEEGTNYLKAKQNINKKDADKHLSTIKSKYSLKELKLVVDKNNEDGKDLVHVHGEVNPVKNSQGFEVELETTITKIEPAIIVLPKFKCKESLDEKEFKEQLEEQEAGINKMKVSKWLKNRQDFLNRIKELKEKGVKNTQGRDPEGDKKAKEIRQRLITEYKINLLADYPEPELENNNLELQKRVEEYGKSKAVLHRVDQIAGGYGTDIIETKLGDARVDYSLGAQWKNRVKFLDEKVKTNVPEKDRENKLMNVVLEYIKVDNYGKTI